MHATKTFYFNIIRNCFEKKSNNGGFHLVDLIITELKDHMTSLINSSNLIGGNFYL